MLLNIVLLVASLGVLTIGAEMLVRGASGVAKLLGVSSLVIGLTIVGFGTSTPELAAGITSSLKGVSDLNVGNVVGSNIFNILMILGITSLICPIAVQMKVVKREVLWVIGAALAIYTTLVTGGTVTRVHGVLLLAGLVFYIVRTYQLGRVETAPMEDIPGVEKGRPRVWLDVVLIAVGLGMLWGGSVLLVDSSVDIARTLGVSELTIALTIVAGGTSAPELITSTVAALRRKTDIAVGNILGSNVFNIFGILGTTSTIFGQKVSTQVLRFDGPVMVLASLALIPIIASGNRITRTEGALMLVAFAAYLVLQFTLVPGWFGAEASVP
ncbi:MAG: calcium/sodium antiporter [Phycisphaerales bacterium]|jgi:cation:H+ antiporter|nr:calcium/sodium antiporter [Phycisphaerales bacterium]